MVKLPPITLPVIDATVAFTLDPVTLPIALIVVDSIVVALTIVVDTLPPVILPVAEICPVVRKLPPSTLPPIVAVPTYNALSTASMINVESSANTEPTRSPSKRTALNVLFTTMSLPVMVPTTLRPPGYMVITPGTPEMLPTMLPSAIGILSSVVP